MAGRKSRDKGARFEREVTNLFQEHGIAAEKIPLSGMVGGRFAGDIVVPVQGRDRIFECKKRAGGFKQLYDWIAEHSGLIVAADRETPLVVLRMQDFIELVKR